MAFRDPYLFQVFELALLANRQLQANSNPERRLQEQVRLVLLWLVHSRWHSAGPVTCCTTEA